MAIKVDPRALALLPFELQAQIAENLYRKDFLPSEIDAIRRSAQPAEKAAAKERMRQGGGDPKNRVGKVATPAKARDTLGAFAGMSGRTVEKIAEIVEAAEAEPEKFGDLVAEMDRTGKVDGAYRKLKQKRDEQKRLAVQPVVGRHRTIVVDPPWDHEGLSVAGRGRPTYAVMTNAELLALPVATWADDECHLYLWTTNNFLLRAGELVQAWGFEYKTVLTWVKPRFGLGSYFRSSTEQCLFAVKGAMTTRVNDIPTHFEAPLGRHSEKPDAFYSIVQRASYPSYLDVFARRARDGWSAWGVEALGAPHA
jgi:N6-adenosine-specific RNA methylase IME4